MSRAATKRNKKAAAGRRFAATPLATFKRILSYFKPYKGGVVFALICLILNVGSTVAGTSMLLVAIENYLSPIVQGVPGADMSGFAMIVGVMAGTQDRVGKNVPVQSLFERFYQLEQCKGVDRVVALGSEADLDLALRTLSPKIDVRFVGEDYIGKDFTGKATCEQYGIRIMYTHRRHGLSSTELRGRIANG